MLPQFVIWVTLGLYAVFMITIALIEYNLNAKRGDTRDYATGSGSVRWPILVMTYIASLMSTWVFFAGPGGYYRGGFGYWFMEMSYMCLFPLLLHFVMSKVWIINREWGDSGCITPADFFCARFPSRPLRLVLGFIFLCASFPYVGSVLLALGNAASMITGGAIDYRSIVIFLGFLIVVYTTMGGIRSVALTDTIQGFYYIAVLVIILFVTLFFTFDGSWTAVVDKIWETNAAWFSYPGPDSWVSYPMRFCYPVQCAIGWTVMLPHVFVRSGFMARNLREQRILGNAVPILQTLVWGMTMLIGMICVAYFGGGLDESVTEYVIPHILSTLVATASPALGKALLVAFFLAACAVGISTADSFLLVSGTIVSHDFIECGLQVNVSPERSLLITRVTVVVIGVIAVPIALFSENLIWAIVQFAIAIVTPLFPALVLGLYWKRATKKAALWSSIVGFVVVMCEWFWWNIGGVWQSVPALLAALVVMVVVSLLTHDDPEESRVFFETLEHAEVHSYKPIEGRIGSAMPAKSQGEAPRQIKLLRSEKIWLAVVVVLFLLYNIPGLPAYGSTSGTLVHGCLTIIPLYIAIYVGFNVVNRSYRLRTDYYVKDWEATYERPVEESSWTPSWAEEE